MARDIVPADPAERYGNLSDRIAGLSQRHRELYEHVHNGPVSGKLAGLEDGFKSTHNRISALEKKVSKGGGKGEEEEEETQRDWYTVKDVKVATEWLETLQEWVDSRLSRRWQGIMPECWPWHPNAVEELLAIEATQRAGHEGSSAVAVQDYLTRWLPTALDRLADEMEDCEGLEHLDSRKRAWTLTTPRRFLDIAHWWIYSRDEDAAPGMTANLST